MNSFFVIIVIIFFVFLSYLLIIIIWPSFANVINYIILGFIWICAVFSGCFQALTFNAPNSKGIILEIHKLALKGEFLTDQYMLTLAMINSKKDTAFFLLLGLAGTIIFAVLFKSFFDLIQIFIADSRLNSSSNNNSNIIKYVFNC